MVVFNACQKDCTVTYTYLGLKPYIVSYKEIRDIRVSSPRAITNYGATTVYGNYIYIADNQKGIHIFDNSNPSNPVQTAFILLPGAENLIINNGKLYANGYIDLFIFDLNNPSLPSLVAERYNFFPTTYEKTNEGIIAYTLQKMNKECNCGEKPELVEEYADGIKFVRVENEDLSVGSDGNIRVAPNSESAQVTKSIIGSTSKYAINNEALYILNDSEIKAYNLDNPLQPILISNSKIQQGETVFPMDKYLMIGTTSAILVYEINADKSLTYVSRLDHTTQCDPVIAKDNYAYATLKSGSGCGWGNSALLIADISNIRYPREVNTFQMSSPNGLGFVGNSLVVTDGAKGVKVFNLTNPTHPSFKEAIDIKNGNDILSLKENRFLVTSDAGIYQFELGKEKSTLISKL